MMSWGVPGTWCYWNMVLLPYRTLLQLTSNRITDSEKVSMRSSPALSRRCAPLHCVPHVAAAANLGQLLLHARRNAAAQHSLSLDLTA